LSQARRVAHLASDAGVCGENAAQVDAWRVRNMRAVFGVVSLLVVLAVVGLLASRQLRAGAGPLAGLPAASGVTVKAQSQQMQQKVAEDIAKAMEQGAAARREDAEK
jgi:hypothetical protein